ncbi:MAG TPA: hypothetical protein PK605_00305 [Ignavibacteria bacterium]|nr:hypothetical protein [Bacteroidota bacterium]HRE10778.1 hypothetical protein [Ignavibacteria bacterium]HRF65979.1 hypothetical protein [Ignavibacteria bacterium]HRJ02820.1 hypothetical protein [Ignavibacteria bacterium]HRJ84378.1 hypothetical protein [Ignavibacteria bacterium]
MAKVKQIATCVGCGCTDDKGCDPKTTGTGLSCCWLEVDYDAQVGICSMCVSRANVDKFKKAVAENFSKKMDGMLEGKAKPLGVNRREFLATERRREGRVE